MGNGRTLRNLRTDHPANEFAAAVERPASALGSSDIKNLRARVTAERSRGSGDAGDRAGNPARGARYCVLPRSCFHQPDLVLRKCCRTARCCSALAGRPTDLATVTKLPRTASTVCRSEARGVTFATRSDPISIRLREALRRVGTPVHFAAGTYTLSAVTSSAFGTSVSNLTCWRVGFLSALARNRSEEHTSELQSQ